MSVCLTNDPQQFFDTRCIAFVVWLFGIRQSIYLECFVFLKNLWKLRTFSLPLCFLSPWVFWWLIAVHCFSHTFHPLRHTWLLALIFPNREATHWKSSILYSIIGLVSYKSFNSLFLVDLENLYLFTFFQNRSRFCLTRSVSLQRNWNVCLSYVIGDLVLFLVHNQTPSLRRLL